MRLKKLALLALVLLSLLATVSFAADEQPKPREPRVLVHFVSRPDYADLYVDGKFVGSTDLALRIPPGVRTIEIKRDGYETWRRELVLTTDNQTRVAAVLKAEKP